MISTPFWYARCTTQSSKVREHNQEDRQPAIQRGVAGVEVSSKSWLKKKGRSIKGVLQQQTNSKDIAEALALRRTKCGNQLS